MQMGRDLEVLYHVIRKAAGEGRQRAAHHGHPHRVLGGWLVVMSKAGKWRSVPLDGTGHKENFFDVSLMSLTVRP